MSELFNPHLKPWVGAKPQGAGNAAQIETYGADLKNIPWQHRSAAPTPYEMALADALEQAFGEGIEDLAPLLKRLNELNVRAPDGADWTEANFRAEMARLGA